MMFVLLCRPQSLVSDSLWPHGLQPIRLPSSWDSLGKNTAVGSHLLFQEIFLPRDRTHISCVSCVGRQILYYRATWELCLAGIKSCSSNALKSLSKTMPPSSAPTRLMSPHCHSSTYIEIIQQWIKNCSTSWKLQQNSRKTIQLFYSWESRGRKRLNATSAHIQNVNQIS